MHHSKSYRIGRCLFLLVALLFYADQAFASRLSEFAPRAKPEELVPGGTRFATAIGEPPILPVYATDKLVGYVYLNSDFTQATGYSGKPISILVGISTSGVITGLKLVEHKEPIVLVGVPEKRVVAAINKLVGTAVGPIASGAERPPQPQIISGATVTVLVMADSVVRSAVRLIKTGRITQQPALANAAEATTSRTIDHAGPGEARDWSSLLADGSVAHLHITVGDVNRAYERSGNAAAVANPQQGNPDDTFIDLYVALLTVPTIGKSLLGESAYNQLLARLKPNQQAILIAGDGLYSFKGSGYVRGGIFDRIELLQSGSGTRFRDRNYERLGSLAAAGAPDLREIGTFTVPEDFDFDPTEPWELQLLVQRATGARDKAFLSFDLGYNLPDRYIKVEQRPVTAQVNARIGVPPTKAAPTSAALDDEPLWKQMWHRSATEVVITSLALLVLTVIFFFQNQLVRRPVVYTWVRRGFLLFTLLWLGLYANAQLSVVNVLTFSNALITGFNWEYFLTSPLIFILWCSVAAALIFWGRGPFCGWLCPFGALQELTNSAAKKLGVPQIRVPWDLHERLWPIKYVVFLALFGMSLYSIAFAEQLSEVEPFKTAIVLKFLREWPFVLYAVALLTIGLFIERFFCRYLCPLGAALAIPGRMRMFEWLRRWPECGKPCGRCAVECPVQSIHPEGHINVNECIYCMHCQELYWDDQRCPHMIQVRLKRAKREAIALTLPPPPAALRSKRSFVAFMRSESPPLNWNRIRAVADALRRRLS